MLKLDVLEKVLTYPTNPLIEYLEEYFVNLHYIPWADGYTKDNVFLYELFCPPEEHLYKDSVMLIAHADIVGDEKNIKLFQSWGAEDNNIICSCGSCCLDDRTGIAIILTTVEKLMKENIYPYVLITGEEERGCHGALALLEDYPELKYLVPDNKIKCLIEVDRRGVNEVVFYDQDYSEFEEVFQVNYSKEVSFAWTDITVLGPMWGLASANVSASYYHEHSFSEIATLGGIKLCSINLYHTILKLLKKAKDIDYFPYKGKMTTACMLALQYNSPPSYTLQG